jgi:hypothetical protein
MAIDSTKQKHRRDWVGKGGRASEGLNEGVGSMKVLTSTVAALGCSGVMVAMAASAHAGACAPRDEFAKHLETNYQEMAQGIGVASDGSMLEIFASRNGTWSLLITSGRKISCIIAAGDMWIAKPSLGPEAALH